jgi:hypothetical protein
MTVISCYREDCWASAELSPKTIDELKESGATWYCAAGHGQVFTGKSKRDRRIADQENRIRRDGWAIEQLTENVRDLILDLRSCPVPGCDYRSRRFTHSLRSGWAVGQLVERIKGDIEGHLAEDHGIVTVPDHIPEGVT